jgi:hypothetical protein
MNGFRKPLAAFNEAGVKYVAVGGLAVVLYGHSRLTADLDLVIALDRDNVLRAVSVLQGLGYAPRAPVKAELFADEALREEWIRERGMTVFSMVNHRNRSSQWTSLLTRRSHLRISQPRPFNSRFKEYMFLFATWPTCLK